MVMTLFHVAGFPSFYSFTCLIVIITIVCFWFNHYKIEEKVFHIGSWLLGFLTLLSIFTGYIIFIDCIFALRLDENVIELIGVPYLKTSPNLAQVVSFLLQLFIILTVTIYRRIRKRILKKM